MHLDEDDGVGERHDAFGAVDGVVAALMLEPPPLLLHLVTQAVLFLLQTGCFELVSDLGARGRRWGRGEGERRGREVRK